jgi:hypothetical protein
LAREPLETRQLLSISVFSAPITSGEVAAPVPVQPSLSVAPLSSPGSPTGLLPSQVKTAYGVNQIAFNGNVAGNGAGQTIAIVDADFDPNIQSDLKTFRPSWDLPTVFAAAFVAAGRYQIAPRPSDRSRGRRIPAGTEADRSGRRESGGPTR